MTSHSGQKEIISSKILKNPKSNLLLSIERKRGENPLMGESKYYIVESSALPEIFTKVLEVKREMERDPSLSAHSATQKVGISRSAFYKYKDLIRPFTDMKLGNIITFQLFMDNQTGILSEVLLTFATWGLNILTINQNIPTEHCATVTISAESPHSSLAIEEFLSSLTSLSGVLSCQLLAG